MGVFSSIGQFNRPTRSYFSSDKAFKVLVEVERVFVNQNRSGGSAFVAECKVLESDCDDMPVGSSQSIYEDLQSKFPELTMKKIHNFVSAALGGGNKSDELTEEVMEDICGEDNPLAGSKVVVCGTPALSKAGKPFSKKSFLPGE